MALSLTVGTNTYISLADAESYVERLYGPMRDAWDALADATKNALLAQATLDIDAHLWRGYKSDADQALEFPRDGDATTDSTYTKVEQACVEQALYRLKYNPEGRQALAAQGVRNFSIGKHNESIAAGGVAILAPNAKRLLREWLLIGACLV